MGENAAEPSFLDEAAKRTSMLPYYIREHKRLAARRFCHARSKENGLKHLDIRTGWLALFWLATFFGVMGLLVMLLADIVTSFLANPVATQIKAEDGDLEFPDVTVCPKSPFASGSSAAELKSLQALRESIKKKLKDAALESTMGNVQAAMLIQLATEGGNTVPRGYDHLVYCQYNGEACSFVNFTELVHLRYIQCFTFTPQNRKLAGDRGLTFVYASQRAGTPFMLLNDLEDSMFTDKVYDGINVFVHNPGTFPTYEISHMPTSFPLRYGQIAHIEISGLQYTSDMSGRKACIKSTAPYRYKNFRGGAKFVEYNYTFEDCVANKKQNHIFSVCGCHSDEIFVPFEQGEGKSTTTTSGEAGKPQGDTAVSTFCRDIRGKTSQTIHEHYLCHKKMVELATTAVLDAYISPDMLYYSRQDPDKRKILRHEICPLPCHKMIYDTKHFEIKRLHEGFQLPPAALATYIKSLKESKLKNSRLEGIYTNARAGLPADELIVVDIRLVRERVDRWQEELTKSAFNLMADIGGTLGLCAGISFLSSFFLLLFFGNAFYHALLSLVYWFWWSVFQGGPPATPLPDKSLTGGDAASRTFPKSTFEGDVSWGRRRTASRILKRKTGSDFTNFGPGGWMSSSRGFETEMSMHEEPARRGSGDPEDVESNPLIRLSKAGSPPKTLPPTAKRTNKRKSSTKAQGTSSEDSVAPAKQKADDTAAKAADAEGAISGTGEDKKPTVTANASQEAKARTSAVKPPTKASGTVPEGEEARSADSEEGNVQDDFKTPDNGKELRTSEKEPPIAEKGTARTSKGSTASDPDAKPSDAPVMSTDKPADTKLMDKKERESISKSGANQQRKNSTRVNQSQERSSMLGKSAAHTGEREGTLGQATEVPQEMTTVPGEVNFPESDSKPETNRQREKSTRVDQSKRRSSLLKYFAAGFGQRHEGTGGQATGVPLEMTTIQGEVNLPESDSKPDGNLQQTESKRVDQSQLRSSMLRQFEADARKREVGQDPVGMADAQLVRSYGRSPDGDEKVPELETVSPVSTPQTPPLDNFAPGGGLGTAPPKATGWGGTFDSTVNVGLQFQGTRKDFQGTEGGAGEAKKAGTASTHQYEALGASAGWGGRYNQPDGGKIPMALEGGAPPSLLFATGAESPTRFPLLAPPLSPTLAGWMEPGASPPPRGPGQLSCAAERLFASQFAPPTFVPTSPPRAPVMERLDLPEGAGGGPTAYIYTLPALGEVDAFPLLPIARQEDMQDYLRNKYGRKKGKAKKAEEKREHIVKINYKNQHKNKKNVW